MVFGECVFFLCFFFFVFFGNISWEPHEVIINNKCVIEVIVCQLYPLALSTVEKTNQVATESSEIITNLKSFT